MDSLQMNIVREVSNLEPVLLQENTTNNIRNPKNAENACRLAFYAESHVYSMVKKKQKKTFNCGLTFALMKTFKNNQQRTGMHYKMFKKFFFLFINIYQRN